jgi:hypothetical protein
MHSIFVKTVGNRHVVRATHWYWRRGWEVGTKAQQLKSPAFYFYRACIARCLWLLVEGLLPVVNMSSGNTKASIAQPGGIGLAGCWLADEAGLKNPVKEPQQYGESFLCVVFCDVDVNVRCC